MKKLRNLAGLFSGFTALLQSGDTLATSGSHGELDNSIALDGVVTAPLNTGALPSYIAQHRSHSSHRSHQSHRSSSGGSYTPSKPKRNSQPLTTPPRPSTTVPSDANAQGQQLETILSDAEKRKNLIMRVQLTLNAFGFYEGEADGIMGKQTRKALNDFRASVHLKQHDKLDVETLNALGILVK